MKKQDCAKSDNLLENNKNIVGALNGEDTDNISKYGPSSRSLTDPVGITIKTR